MPPDDPTTLFAAFAAAAGRMAALAPRCARRQPHLSHVFGPDDSRLCAGVLAVDPQPNED